MGYSLRKNRLSTAVKNSLTLLEYMQGVTYIQYEGATYFLTPNDKYTLGDVLSRTDFSEDEVLWLELRQPTGAGTGQSSKFSIKTVIACLEEMCNRKNQNHR